MSSSYWASAILVFCLYFAFASFRSQKSMASHLEGVWSRCDTTGKKYDVLHLLEFKKGNVELELHSFFHRKGAPCLGRPAFAIASSWYYLVQKDMFTSTRFSTYAVALDDPLVAVFRKKKICSFEDWILGKRVDCTGEVFGRGVLKIGAKTSHRFHLKEARLYLTTMRGEEYIYRPED